VQQCRAAICHRVFQALHAPVLLLHGRRKHPAPSLAHVRLQLDPNLKLSHLLLMSVRSGLCGKVCFIMGCKRQTSTLRLQLDTICDDAWLAGLSPSPDVHEIDSLLSTTQHQ
jgi:hypothetical protein